MSDCYLSDAVLSKLSNILGDEHVECVEEAVLYYWVKKSYYSKSAHIKAMNKKLEEVREHIQSIREILSDSMIVNYMMEVADTHLADKGGKDLIGYPSAFINRGPVLKEIDGLDSLDGVCEVAIGSQKTGKGRAKGSKDNALHLFINRLCECCEKSNGGPLMFTKNNLLEQVMKVLNMPMELGGVAPSIVRKTIESRRSSQ